MPPKKGKGATKLLTPAKTSSDIEKQVCSICEDVIVDASASKKGQESIFCEGPCGSWLHRCCAGLSKAAFASVSKSPDKFSCPPCHLCKNENELGRLRQRVVDLECKLDALLAKFNQGRPCFESSASSELLADASGTEKGGEVQPHRDQPSRGPPPDMSRRFNLSFMEFGSVPKVQLEPTDRMKT